MSRRRWTRLAALMAAAALLGAAGCGADGDGEAAGPDEAAGVGPARVGSVASLAQCSDWQAGTRAERIVTIHDIREQLNQTGAAEPTSDLDDDAAYELFERACAEPFAAGFRLYKIYARGAAFASLKG